MVESVPRSTGIAVEYEGVGVTEDEEESDWVGLASASKTTATGSIFAVASIVADNGLEQGAWGAGTSAALLGKMERKMRKGD